MRQDLESSVRQKYRSLTLLLIEKQKTISTMESCTAGEVSSLITDTEGSSSVFRGSYITYCNEEKIRLGVPEEVIEKYGVYSDQTAAEMAETCRKAFRTDIGVGITGSFANIDPNNADSIPGEVFLAVSSERGTKTRRISVPTGQTRAKSKLSTASEAADMILEALK